MQAAASSIRRTNAIEPWRIGFSRSRSWMRAFGILVLDDQVRVGDVELQQLARGELVIEPVDRAVLQVRERIVPGRARQLVLAEHRLLLPRVELIGRVRRDGLPSIQSPRSIVWPP